MKTGNIDKKNAEPPASIAPLESPQSTLTAPIEATPVPETQATPEPEAPSKYFDDEEEPAIARWPSSPPSNG